MSQEIFEIVRGMDLKKAETQMAIQCAPLIAGRKPSNLLIVEEADLCNVKKILQKTGISFYILLTMNGKVTLLLYQQEQFAAFLANLDSMEFLKKQGYKSDAISGILAEFQVRYEAHRRWQAKFPHEMGVLLGYPIEDVIGFVENQGKKFLYCGYWKVYANLPAKLKIFKDYEDVRETIIQLLSNGVSLTDVIEIYQEETQKRAAV